MSREMKYVVSRDEIMLIKFSHEKKAPLSAEADAAAAKTEKKELVLDTDFENVNVVKLLGLQRLKKKARKNKSTTNGGK